MEAGKILLAEDEGIVAKDISKRLGSLGYAVLDVVSSGEEAVKKAMALEPDLVLMDIMLRGEMDGISAAAQISDGFNIPIIFVTAYADSDTLQRAKHALPFGYIMKPFKNAELQSSIEMALFKSKISSRLKRNERWLSTILTSIADAVIATDANGAVTFMNPNAETLTHWKSNDALGKKITDVFKILNEGIFYNVSELLLERVIQQGENINIVDRSLMLFVKEQLGISIDCSIAPIRDEKGRVTGAVLAFRDITEQKRIEVALEKAHEQLKMKVIELEQKAKETEDFTYAISHDLKGPLSSIQGFVNELRRSVKEKNLKKADFCLNRIEANGRQLESLIYDLLELSRIGLTDSQLGPVDLNEVIEKIINRLDTATKTKEVKIKVQQRLPQILANPHKIDQVISNLIANALQYLGDRDDPLVELGFLEQDHEWVIYVKDNGIGIDDPHHQKIFNIFERLPEAKTLHPKGTGIGLAVVKKIVELFHGKVWVESKVGIGSTFYFTIPKREPGQTAAILQKTAGV